MSALHRQSGPRPTDRQISQPCFTPQMPSAWLTGQRNIGLQRAGQAEIGQRRTQFTHQVSPPTVPGLGQVGNFKGTVKTHTSGQTTPLGADPGHPRDIQLKVDQLQPRFFRVPTAKHRHINR